MNIDVAKRIFKYGKESLDDINPKHSPAQIMQGYVTIYPELINAKIAGPEIKGAELHYEFILDVGTKG